MPPLRSFTWSFSLYAMQRLRVIPCAAKRSVSTALIQLHEWTQHPVCPPQAVPFTAHKPREHPWNKKKHHPCPNQNHCANGTAYVSNDSKYLFFFQWNLDLQGATSSKVGWLICHEICERFLWGKLSLELLSLLLVCLRVYVITVKLLTRRFDLHEISLSMILKPLSSGMTCFCCAPVL